MKKIIAVLFIAVVSIAASSFNMMAGDGKSSSTDVQFRPKDGDTTIHPRMPQYVPVWGMYSDGELFVSGYGDEEAFLYIYDDDQTLLMSDRFNIASGYSITFSDYNNMTVIVCIGGCEYIAVLKHE